MRKPGKNLVLGVDIGGTKVAAALVDSSGASRKSARTRMITQRSAAEGMRAVFEAIDSILNSREGQAASAIGVSVPGWVDSRRGVLVGATNIPCWKDFPLAREIERRYRLPVRIANDANVAALAEARWGAGAPYRNIFYATLGTGIGTGMVLDGKLFEGRTGAAGEGGHNTIDIHGPLCGCGKRGCIEAYASGTGIAREARERIAEKGAAGSRLLKFAGGNIASITSEQVSAVARAGDKFARSILEDVADHLAIWIGNMIDLLDPDVVIIGGGVGRLMISFHERMRKQLETWAINPGGRQVPIVEAHFGSESALVGAAALCLPPQVISKRKSRR
jgi:glucokinase